MASYKCVSNVLGPTKSCVFALSHLFAVSTRCHGTAPSVASEIMLGVESAQTASVATQVVEGLRGTNAGIARIVGTGALSSTLWQRVWLRRSWQVKSAFQGHRAGGSSEDGRRRHDEARSATGREGETAVDASSDRKGDAGAAGGTQRPNSCTAARDEATRSRTDPSCLACNKTDSDTSQGCNRKPRQAHEDAHSRRRWSSELGAKQTELEELAHALRDKAQLVAQLPERVRAEELMGSKDAS